MRAILLLFIVNIINAIWDEVFLVVDFNETYALWILISSSYPSPIKQNTFFFYDEHYKLHLRWNLLGCSFQWNNDLWSLWSSLYPSPIQQDTIFIVSIINAIWNTIFLVVVFNEAYMTYTFLDLLSTPPPIQQELYSYCNRPRRTILEVLQDFPHVSSTLPFEFLFDVIPPIQPRAFSIASSPKASQNMGLFSTFCATQ